MIKNESLVVEVIGRLQGRARSHADAAKQTNCEKKREAHLSASDDLKSLAFLLSEATDNPAYYRSNEAYKRAVSRD